MYMRTTQWHLHMPSDLKLFFLLLTRMHMCPSRELAVSLEVEKANGQLLLQTDTVSTERCAV